ncbi:MAG: hypothetical protein WCI77_07820 [Candidatus Omnitrophota bacterium]
MQNLFINVTGIYLITTGTILVAVSFFVGLLSKNPGAYKFSHEFPFFLAPIVYILLLGCWPIFTGMALMAKKNWARYSLFVMSIFAIAIGLSSGFSLLFLSRSQATVDATARSLYAFFISLVNFIFFIGIPTYFLIFFNKKAVRQLFSPRDVLSRGERRTFGITLIAFIAFVNAIFLCIFTFSSVHNKIPLFGTFSLSGHSAKAYFFICALINIYIAFGFFYRRKLAWFTYIIFTLISVVIGIINSFSVTSIRLRESVPNVTTSYNDIPKIVYNVSGGVGILITLVFLCYVISKKQFFSKRSAKTIGT